MRSQWVFPRFVICDEGVDGLGELIFIIHDEEELDG